MKIALCFNISYKNSLTKEKIWKEWVYYNRDIINIYFHTKNSLVKSPWIRKHCIPISYVKETTYFHIVPALMSLLSYAYKDKENRWFCFLTDSCIPLVSPEEFRTLFFQYYEYTIFRWYEPNWNVQFHKRANLFKLPKHYQLANDPWFVMTRVDAMYCLAFTQSKMYRMITEGIIANESIFAIALLHSHRLKAVINRSSSISDWVRMSSPTSPYVFLDDSVENMNYIANAKKNKLSWAHPPILSVIDNRPFYFYDTCGKRMNSTRPQCLLRTCFYLLTFFAGWPRPIFEDSVLDVS